MTKKVSIIGAESTGKSTLTQQLAEHFESEYISEYAREYITNLKKKYVYKDLIFIAKKQIELEQNYFSEDSFIFLDTDLIITKVWFSEVFKKIPDWIDKEILANKADFYLLCNNDIEWKEDPVRENGGERREYLFNLYEKELIKINANYKIISGTGKKRFNNAKKTIFNLQATDENTQRTSATPDF